MCYIMTHGRGALRTSGGSAKVGASPSFLATIRHSLAISSWVARDIALLPSPMWRREGFFPEG